jgi:hypothetical protein
MAVLLEAEAHHNPIFDIDMTSSTSVSYLRPEMQKYLSVVYVSDIRMMVFSARLVSGLAQTRGFVPAGRHSHHSLGRRMNKPIGAAPMDSFVHDAT